MLAIHLFDHRFSFVYAARLPSAPLPAHIGTRVPLFALKSIVPGSGFGARRVEHNQ